MKIEGFFEGTGMPDPGWWEALWPDPAAVLAAAGVRSGDLVVDLCCGDGWFTLPLAKIARRVVAVDIDAALVETARTRLGEAGATNCAFVTGDAYDLPALVGETVDHVFLANAFHGVPDKTRLARAVASVLAPGGRFAIVNWHERPREETRVLGQPRGPASELRMTPGATIAAVEPSGLRVVATADVSPHHYGVVFARDR
jgi:SAM-dependent methyltransferase